MKKMISNIKNHINKVIAFVYIVDFILTVLINFWPTVSKFIQISIMIIIGISFIVYSNELNRINKDIKTKLFKIQNIFVSEKLLEQKYEKYKMDIKVINIIYSLVIIGLFVFYMIEIFLNFGIKT